MATLKDVQEKISAIKKTKQITRAMNMVAASRLRGAQTNMEAFRPYASKFSEVLGNLSERSGKGARPVVGLGLDNWLDEFPAFISLRELS